MKRSLPFLITLSLLLGILVTIGTSHVVGARGGESVSNCGFSVSSSTGQHTTLKECLLSTYGWPLKYTTSGVAAILRDYHTIVPGQPANAGSIIGYTSFSRLKFAADWLMWSVVSGLVVAIASTATKPKKKP